MPKLTAKQEMFCLEYLVDLNATEAAKRAGYSHKTARSTGSENMTKPDIQDRIRELNQERLKRVEVDADMVLKILYDDVTADLADLFTEAGDLKPVHEWPMEFRTGLVAGLDSEERTEQDGKTKRKVADVMKIKLADRTRIKELLGKHIKVGAFSDKIDHSSKDGSMTPTVVERLIVYPPGQQPK